MTLLLNFFLNWLQKQEWTFLFSNQRNQVLYIGMLRHCTVTAVKTNITPVSCSGGTVWRQDKSGEDRQRRVKARECEWSISGLPKDDQLMNNIEKFCANFTTVYFDLKHRDNISRKIRFFPLKSSNNKVQLYSGPFPADFCLCLLKNHISFMFKKAQTLSVSLVIHGNYDCCHMTLLRE